MNADKATVQPTQAPFNDEKASVPPARQPEAPPRSSPVTPSAALATAIFSGTFVGSLVGIVGCIVACRHMPVGILLAFALQTSLYGYDRVAADSLLSTMFLALRTAAFGGFVIGGVTGVVFGLIMTYRYLVHGKQGDAVKRTTSCLIAEGSDRAWAKSVVHVVIASSSTPVAVAILRWWFDGPIDVVNADPVRFTTIAFAGSVVGETVCQILRSTRKRAQLSGDDAISATSSDPSAKV